MKGAWGSSEEEDIDVLGGGDQGGLPRGGDL